MSHFASQGYEPKIAEWLEVTLVISQSYARWQSVDESVSQALELWGPEGREECKVKFDVADVAYLVVSLGKMIESGFTFSLMTTSATCTRVTNVLRSFENVESSCCE